MNEYSTSLGPGGGFNPTVSIFKGSTNTTPTGVCTLAQVLDRIRGEAERPFVQQLRATLHAQGKKAYAAAKKRSWAFTPGGVFTQRANRKLTQPSGLLNYDLDHLADLAAAKARLQTFPALVYFFVSPSGAGLKLGCWASAITDHATYRHAWLTVLEALQAAYPDLSVTNDKHCKDIARLCYLSWDPAAYQNPAPVCFPMPASSPQLPAPTMRTRTGGPARPPRPGTDEQARAEEALQAIPADEYDTWLRVGMALHSSGETWGRAVWDTWSQQSAKYDAATQDEKWNSFTPEAGVTLGTVFYLAQQHGAGPARTDQRRNGETSGTGGSWQPLPYSDTTNALAFVRDHCQDLRYCWPWHQWLVWTDTHWHRDDTGTVRQKGKQTIKRLARHAEDLGDAQAKALMAHVKKSLSTGSIKAMLEGAQDEPGIPVLPEALDSHRWLINCRNGTLDLQTGTLRPHAQADLLTFMLPVAYDPQALCPTWDAFLARIMADNQSLISFLQRAIGYALTGIIREHVLLILWGTGRNGKSTFLNSLRTLLGPYAMKAPSELLMVSNNDRHPTERADLCGKRFVAAIETEQGRKLAEVFVKEATGGDPIRARRMREDFWEFQPTHKVFLATNHKPIITGTDTAIWDRIRLVPFAVTIPPDERDATLPEKLEKETPGILAWAVQGCLAWQQQGLGMPDEVRYATAGYRRDMDVLGQFISDCCLTGPNYRTKAADLYSAYQHWCDQQGVAWTMQRTWGMQLTDRGFERFTNNGTWYRNIGLLDQTHTPTEGTEGTEGENGIHSCKNLTKGRMPKIGSVPSVPSVEEPAPLVPEDEPTAALFPPGRGLSPQPRCLHPETRTETMPDGSSLRRCTTCKRVIEVLNHS